MQRPSDHLKKNPCTTCKYLIADPHGVDILTNDDFIGSGYANGHLVPDIDYGNSTFIVSNIVLQNNGFNKGLWKQTEEFLHNQWKEKLVLKGCVYTEKYIVSQLGNKLYVPSGCHYAVFDSSDIEQIKGLKLLDYGYMDNSNSSSLIKSLPDWLTCQ